MFSAMTFDYQNPDTKKRRQCSKCGAFLGPAATYCSRCGQTAVGGGVKFVKWLIILVLIIVAVGYFRASDFHPVEWVETKLDDLLESSEKPVPEKPRPATTKPQPQKPVPAPDKPQPRPETAKPQADVLKLTVGRNYHTQRGYVASLKQEWLLEYKKHIRNGNQEAQKKMRDERQIGNLKAGLTVNLLELNSRENWVKVRIQGKKTVFYTTAEALVE
jgi:ribosomal protein S27AE